MKKILYLMVFICATGFAQEKTSFGYAAHLMQSRDYYRAISEFKRIAFFSKDSTEIQASYMQIARAYYKSGHFKSSVSYCGTLLNMGGLSSQLYLKSENYLGLNYYALGMNARADAIFSRNAKIDSSGFSTLFDGLVKTDALKWQEASAIFNKLKDKQNRALSILGTELSDRVSRGRFLSYKSPVLSGVLSALIPGSGQLYSEHPVDALQAFLFVGAFAFSSYAAYKYDSQRKGPYIATGLALGITSLFHFGNILGAYKTAQYYNQKKQNDFINGIREKILEIDY